MENSINTKTIDFYDANAEDIYNKFKAINLTESHDLFLDYITEDAHILDAGCGSGRCTEYFLEQGYKVTAFDLSKELLKFIPEHTNLSKLHLAFQDMDFNEEFDAVWASASLLHVPYEDMRSVYEKIHQSLKKDGVFYASYKYGYGHVSKDRDFYDMNEDKVMEYIDGLFDIIRIEVDSDLRNKKGMKLQPWFKFIARKK